MVQANPPIPPLRTEISPSFAAGGSTWITRVSPVSSVSVDWPVSALKEPRISLPFSWKITSPFSRWVTVVSGVSSPCVGGDWIESAEGVGSALAIPVPANGIASAKLNAVSFVLLCP